VDVGADVGEGVVENGVAVGNIDTDVEVEVGGIKAGVGDGTATAGAHAA